MNWIDVPPLWLAFFTALAWGQARFWPAGLSLMHPVTSFLGGVLVGGGLVLIVLAAVEFRKHNTTIVPHRVPTRIIQSGVYSRSRNPIYLGDALILTGLCLRWDAIPSLALIPVFVWIIERRFILPEENRMRRQFKAEYAKYAQKTRRWV